MLSGDRIAWITLCVKEKENDGMRSSYETVSGDSKKESTAERHQDAFSDAIPALVFGSLRRISIKFWEYKQEEEKLFFTVYYCYLLLTRSVNSFDFGFDTHHHHPLPGRGELPETLVGEILASMLF